RRRQRRGYRRTPWRAGAPRAARRGSSAGRPYAPELAAARVGDAMRHRAVEPDGVARAQAVHGVVERDEGLVARAGARRVHTHDELDLAGEAALSATSLSVSRR